MKRRDFLIALARILLVALAIGGCVAVVHWQVFGPTCGNTPRQMFAGIVREPVLPEVSRIQGVGDMAQSYNIWLRFQATEGVIDDLLADGFREVPWSEVGEVFRLPNGWYDRFRPGWAPERVAQRRCYRVVGRPCAWSKQGGRQSLVVDHESGKVYVFASGD